MLQSYSQFSKYEHLTPLGITVRKKALFAESPKPIAPSSLLTQVLAINMRKPMASEKAKSELLIVPILNELTERNHDSFTYFSGYSFEVDSSLGLTGRCDFVLTTEPNALVIESPVFCVVEAKNADIDRGIPQCIAQMYAAQQFNIQKNKPFLIIYGVVTIGNEWLFLRLEENKTVHVDTDYFYTKNLPELLGALQFVIDFYTK